MICHIPKSCNFIDITPKVVKKINSVVPLIHNEERIRDLNTLVLEHLRSCIEESYDYGDWVNQGISFYKAKLPIDTFLEFSKVGDDKYNEKTAIKKWNSFKYEQNAGDLFNRLKKKGIDVSTFAKMK